MLSLCTSLSPPLASKWIKGGRDKSPFGAGIMVLAAQHSSSWVAHTLKVNFGVRDRYVCMYVCESRRSPAIIFLQRRELRKQTQHQHQQTTNQSNYILNSGLPSLCFVIGPRGQRHSTQMARLMNSTGPRVLERSFCCFNMSSQTWLSMTPISEILQ